MLKKVVIRILAGHKFETLDFRSGIWVPNVEDTAIKTSTRKGEDGNDFSKHGLQILFL